MNIREAGSADWPAILDLHREAFTASSRGYGGEAELAQMLSEDGDITLSLVAEEAGSIIGSNILSVKNVEGDGHPVRAWAVGPIAVQPARQGEHIGSALMQAAIKEAEKHDIQMLFLLGDPEYYTRFGFSADTAEPFSSPFSGPYFQALLLDKQLKLPNSGRAEYAAAFGRL